MIINEQNRTLKPPVISPHEPTAKSSRIPPLENGDRLTRPEFERRYKAMRQVKKAELIEGVVYMPSRWHFEGHSEPHAHLVGWLFVYVAATPRVRLGDNATVRLDVDNEVQPDALLRIESAHLRSSLIDEDDYVQGAPELVVEIAASSATHDLRQKLNVYRRNGGREYIVWQVYDQQIDWFHLRDEVYHPLLVDANGVVRSSVFPGLWLHRPAMLAGDLATVLAELHQGLHTPEHREFAERLQAP
jgi:Uma2 family endonuclease